MMTYRRLLACSMLAALPSAANAADFLGSRVQLLIGWDGIDAESKRFDVDKHISGATFGIATGYDFPLGPTGIIGIGTSGTFQSNSAKRTIGDTKLKFEAKRDFELAARAGAILQDSVLLYAKIGAATSKVKIKATRPDGFEESESKSGWGLRLGAGAEFSIGDPLALVLEYRYTDYEKGFTRNQVIGGISYRFSL